MNKEELLQEFAEPIKILDHGYVCLVDVMGDDQAIVDAARTSYDKASTKHTRGNRGLVRYLMRCGHHSPFEMCEIKVQVRAPLFVRSQWVRHRTANWNEFSGRYSEMLDLHYVPALDRIARQSDTNKQGSGKVFESGQAAYVQARLDGAAKAAFEHYQVMLSEEVARETARINLPLSQYTQWVWKVDLRNLLHFIHLRMDHHAQYEIQVYAKVLWQIVQKWVPFTAEAFADYVLDALTFSKGELQTLRNFMVNLSDIDAVEQGSLSEGEAREFLLKLKKLQRSRLD